MGYSKKFTVSCILNHEYIYLSLAIMPVVWMRPFKLLFALFVSIRYFLIVQYFISAPFLENASLYSFKILPLSSIFFIHFDHMSFRPVSGVYFLLEHSRMSTFSWVILQKWTHITKYYVHLYHIYGITRSWQTTSFFTLFASFSSSSFLVCIIPHLLFFS